MDQTMKFLVRMPYLKWRDGRPRWEPNAALIAAGWRGQDLKHPDGRWFSFEETQGWVNGRMREVEARRAALTTAAAAGKRRPRMHREKVLTLAGLVDHWSKMIEQRLEDETKAGVILTLAPRTVADYVKKAQWLLRFDPELAAAPAASLSQIIAADLYSRMRLKAGDHMAPAVIRVASAMYSWAMLKGVVRVDGGQPFTRLRMKTPDPRQRAATVAEILHMVAAADALRLPEIGDSILLGVWTGQRQGDRLALQETAIAGNGGGRIIFRQAKTGARVAVPQSDELLARLVAMRQRRREARVESLFVIVDESTGQPFKADWYRKLFARVRAAAAAGIEGDLEAMPSCADIRDQDLRDTAVTWLALAECTTEEIRSITGHDRETILSILKHYIADHDGFADSAVSKVQRWYEKETG